MPDADRVDQPVDEPAEPRQHIQRVRGARRAKLTPAPGTITEPLAFDEDDDTDAAAASDTASAVSGPNDAQLRRDVPPHY